MSKQKKKVRSTGRLSAITTCISITLVLILLGSVVLFVSVGNNFSRQLREGLTVELLLSDSTATNDVTGMPRQPMTISSARNSSSAFIVERSIPSSVGDPCPVSHALIVVSDTSIT